MKKLILIRHAKSSWKFPDLKDKHRPLKKRGENDAPLMGRVLKSLNVMPDMIVSSPAVRATATAQFIAHEISFPDKQIKNEPALYMEPEAKVIKAINKLEDNYSTVYLVGHNPGLTDLANNLTGESIDNIPTSGIYGIEFDCNTWAEVEKGKGKKLFFEVPKTHRDKIEKTQEPVL